MSSYSVSAWPFQSISMTLRSCTSCSTLQGEQVNICWTILYLFLVSRSKIWCEHSMNVHLAASPTTLYGRTHRPPRPVFSLALFIFNRRDATPSTPSSVFVRSVKAWTALTLSQSVSVLNIIDRNLIPLWSVQTAECRARQRKCYDEAFDYHCAENDLGPLQRILRYGEPRESEIHLRLHLHDSLLLVSINLNLDDNFLIWAKFQVIRFTART